MLLASGASLGIVAAEQTVLRIDGDRIAVLESEEEESAIRVIDRYYALLAEELRDRARALQESLAKLVEDYDVAFSAADTAEVNNVLTDLAYHWAALRTLHAQQYTPQAAAAIQQAYGSLYPMIAIDDTASGDY